MRPDHTYVNIGFWSSVPAGPTEGHTNRLIEQKISELDGHKSLYSDAFYSAVTSSTNSTAAKPTKP